MYFIAGGMLIKMKKEAKQSQGYIEPTNSIHHMAIAACYGATTLLAEEHALALPFIGKTGEEAGKKFWRSYELRRRVDYEKEILPRLRTEEDAIITETSKALANIMPALTTELWKWHKAKRDDIAEDAKLDEFLGMGEIDDANEQLTQAMETNEGKAMDGYIKKRISRSFKKHLAKERTATRKNLRAPPKTRRRRPPTMVQR